MKRNFEIYYNHDRRYLYDCFQFSKEEIRLKKKLN